MGLSCPPVCQSLVLVSGYFLPLPARCRAVLPIPFLCCAWERSGSSSDGVPGLADGQATSAVSVLLCWTWIRLPWNM